ncbi:zinc finger, CCHC-type containing protein [Tanacetum coccineum]|uniref:Zinc finger, CCHC-type containing protein n=1 Tax=Tanacetum coccineum TaxID=301880 RepID=A0ABQ5IC50_9ASTR
MSTLFQCSGVPDRASGMSTLFQCSGVPDRASGMSTLFQCSGVPDRASGMSILFQCSGVPDRASGMSTLFQCSGVPDRASGMSTLIQCSGVLDRASVPFSLLVDLNIKYPKSRLAEDSSALVLQALKRSSSIFTSVYVAVQKLKKSLARASVKLGKSYPYSSRPSYEGYRNTIELPDGNNVVPLQSDTIRLVQNGCSFHGLWSEDPNQHLKDFLKLVDLVDLDVTNRERTRLLLFQFFLRDQAINWLERLPAGSISTWEDLTTRFLAQFLPQGRIAKSRMTS